MSSMLPGVYEIPHGHIAIVERFGQFDRILTTGLNFINPITCSVKHLSDWKGVATKCGYLMELTQQQLETEKRQCHTKDHVMVQASATIHFKIIDPKKAIYEIDRLPDSLKDVCSKAFRSKIGSIVFDDVFLNREQISQSLMEELAVKVQKWGVCLLGVEVGDLDFDPEIAQAMKKRRIAEVDKDASLAKVEADSVTALKIAQTEQEKKKIQADTNRLQAESEAAAATIKAQGLAEAIKIETTAKVASFRKMKEEETAYLGQLAQQVGKAGSVQILTATQAVEGLKALAANTSHKMILIPSDFKGMMKIVESPAS